MNIDFSAVPPGGRMSLPKAFPARFKGDCPRCKNKINVGDGIVSRTTVDPWVHDGCQFVLRPHDAINVNEWQDGLKDRFFTGSNTGMAYMWELRDEPKDETLAMSWWSPHGEGWPEFHMAYVPGVLFKCVHPSSLFRIFDALHANRGTANTTDDEFEAYRQKLLEKLT